MKKIILLVLILSALPVLTTARARCKMFYTSPSSEALGGFYGYVNGDYVDYYLTNWDYTTYYWDSQIESESPIVGIGNFTHPVPCQAQAPTYCKAVRGTAIFYDEDCGGDVHAVFEQPVTDRRYTGRNSSCEGFCTDTTTSSVYIEHTCVAAF